MTAVISFIVFAGAAALSVGVIAAMVAPQWRRITRLAMGQVEPQFAPLRTLAIAEQRIAVRRWATTPMPAGIRRLRAAA